MKIRTRLGDSLAMWKRNGRVIINDVSIRKTVRTLVFIWLFGLAVLAVLWCVGYLIHARMCAGTGAHIGCWDYLFSFIGAVDAAVDLTTASGVYTMSVRLLGAIMIGGLVTSCLCAIAERISTMALKGLIVSTMYDHVLILGYDDQTDDLIRKLLMPKSDWGDLTCWYPGATWGRRPRRVRVLLYTCGDVETIRNEMNAVLPRNLRGRVQYVYGDMKCSVFARTDTRRILSIQNARQIFIMGDAASPTRGDIENLGCADAVAEMLRNRPRKPVGRYRDFPIPVYVRMDRISSFDLPKRMDFKLAMPNVGCSRRLEEVQTYFKPFSVNEGWARAMWGGIFPLYAPTGLENAPAKWHDSRLASRLDFRPMEAGDYVHVVVGPLNAMGEALVIEAIRVAHYRVDDPTRITIVETKDAVRRRFRVRYEQAFALTDVKIDFMDGDFNSDSVRMMLAEEAKNRKCLLTIAVCLADSDESLETAISLPEDVYCGFDGQEDVPEDRRISSRLEYRKDPPRIWFYQAHFRRLDAGGDRLPQVRFRQVNPFGMQELGIRPWYLKGFPAMYLNAVYDWPLDANGENKLEELLAARNGAYSNLSGPVSEFCAKWKDSFTKDKVQTIDVREKVELLTKILTSDPRLAVAFKMYAFRRLVMMDCARMWGNIYVEDSYPTLLRALGLHVVMPDPKLGHDFAELCERNCKAFKVVFARGPSSEAFGRSLAETEHRRWMADRALMGFRNVAADRGERKDGDFRHHDCMVSFDKLRPSDQLKDMMSLAHGPLFMALDGLEVRTDGKN